jgi:outer membrane immunogenic protein
MKQSERPWRSAWKRKLARSLAGKIMSRSLLILGGQIRRSALSACLFATAIALLVLAGVARAADIAAAPAVKAPAAPAYQWSGCYAGLNAGGGASASNFTTTVGTGTFLVGSDPATVSNDGTGSGSGSNFLGGGQAGCNWQSGTVVFGVEGDFDYYRSNSNFLNNTDTLAAGTPFAIGQSLKTDYLATIRPRLGIAADRNFAYITGGVAFTEARYTETYSDGAGGVGTASASKSLTGWTAGAGWEYALAAHWTVRVEYLFSGFSTTSATGSITGAGASNPLQGSGNLIIQVARAGVNFKF